MHLNIGGDSGSLVNYYFFIFIQTTSPKITKSRKLRLKLLTSNEGHWT